MYNEITIYIGILLPRESFESSLFEIEPRYYNQIASVNQVSMIEYLHFVVNF